MTPANFKIVKIMSRCNLNSARPLLGIRIFICNNRYLTPSKRQHNHLADKIAITLIIGVNSNSHIAKHRFRAGCCNCDHSVHILHRIMELPHFAVHVFLFNFEIRNRCLEFRIPVDQPLIPVNQAVLMQFYKNFADRIRQALIHGEPATLPISAYA